MFYMCSRDVLLLLLLWAEWLNFAVKFEKMFSDKNNSPTHSYVSISDIRLARVTTNTSGGVTTISVNTSNSTDDQLQSTSSGLAHQTLPQTIATAGSSTTAPTQLTVVDGRSTGANLTQNTSSTIVAIKQEQLATVDNLVGSFVDSTTFLHSPSNSQMVNPNLVQNNCGAGNNAEASEGDFPFQIHTHTHTHKMKMKNITQDPELNKKWFSTKKKHTHLTDKYNWFYTELSFASATLRRHFFLWHFHKKFGHFSFHKKKKNAGIRTRFGARYLIFFFFTFAQLAGSGSTGLSTISLQSFRNPFIQIQNFRCKCCFLCHSCK